MALYTRTVVFGRFCSVLKRRAIVCTGMHWRPQLGTFYSLVERPPTLPSTPVCKLLWKQESGQLHRSWQLRGQHTADFDMKLYITAAITLQLQGPIESRASPGRRVQE